MRIKVRYQGILQRSSSSWFLESLRFSDKPSLVLRFAITVTYLHHAAAGVLEDVESLSKRCAKSSRVNLQSNGLAICW
jgi:hypothetical protein